MKKREQVFSIPFIIIAFTLLFQFTGQVWGADADEIQQWLDAHNNYRTLHGVPPVTWSATVAASAQSWADTCTWEHSGCGYGENMFGCTTPRTPQQIVDYWYSEEPNYDYSNPGYYENPGTGHFTQVVWKSTTEIGCGYKSGCSGGWPYIYVCHYNPAGNVLGQFAENVFPPQDPSEIVQQWLYLLLLD